MGWPSRTHPRAAKARPSLVRRWAFDHSSVSKRLVPRMLSHSLLVLLHVVVLEVRRPATGADHASHVRLVDALVVERETHRTGCEIRAACAKPGGAGYEVV